MHFILLVAETFFAQKLSRISPTGKHRPSTRSTDLRAKAEDYKGRNVVERAINRLKDFRAVAARYNKRGHNYLAVVAVATIVIWLL
jgi:transposase